MKQIVLFVFLAYSLSGFAQINPRLNHMQTPELKVLPNLPGVNHEPAANTTGTQTHLDLPDEIRLQARGTDVFLYDSIYQWEWDTFANDWQLASKFIDLQYNADNYPTNVTEQLWNGSEWVNNSQEILAYDANNNLTSEIYKEWNGSAWENIFHTIHTYDANGNRTNDITQNWNGTAWENSYQYVYTYNANNRILTELDQYWNGTGWDNVDLYTYTYDANGNQINYLVQTFNDVDLTWENASNTVYTYDASNRLLTNTYQYWDEISVSWIDASRATYTYDASNRISTYLAQYFNTIEWVNSSLSTYTYDANGNISLYFVQYWNTTNWGNGARITYTYNADHLLVKSLYETWDGGSWVRSSISFYTYDKNDYEQSYSTRYYIGDSDFVSSGDSTFNFFHIVSGVKDFATDNSSISVFPNPGSGKFTISSENTLGLLSVYNLLGERIYTNDKLTGQSSAEVDLTNYGTGMYVITMTEGIKVFNKKIIIQ